MSWNWMQKFLRNGAAITCLLFIILFTANTSSASGSSQKSVEGSADFSISVATQGGQLVVSEMCELLA